MKAQRIHQQICNKRMLKEAFQSEKNMVVERNLDLKNTRNGKYMDKY